jgi:ribosomal protein S12
LATSTCNRLRSRWPRRHKRSSQLKKTLACASSAAATCSASAGLKPRCCNSAVRREEDAVISSTVSLGLARCKAFW